MTTLATASLSREHQEHRACMVGLFTISLGVRLATCIMIATLAAVQDHTHRDRVMANLPPVFQPLTAKNDWLLSGYPGCRQAEETVVMRRLFWY